MIRLSKKFNFMTHLPVIKSVCDIFLPRGILELGCGRHSTPFFYNYDGIVISVENDKKWCDLIRKECPDNEKFKLVHHNLGEKINRKTKYNEVSKKDFKCIKKYYNNILNQYDLNFLFIDHLRSIRLCALQYLYSRFDIIVYHDSEDKNKQYKYYALDISSEYFYHWNYCSFSSNTGIIIRKMYKDKLYNFDEKIKYYGDKFLKGINKNKKYIHKIKKYYE